MSISSENAGGEIPRVPPGFRFHPTEEELLNYYLAKKVSSGAIDDLGVIRDVDLNKLEPWDIQDKCGIGSAAQADWYFFSHKDRKYPTGTRTNRATAAGFWKATGRDKAVYSPADCRQIGMRKTLVFHIGRAPHGRKSNWIMHEYRLDGRQSDDRRNTTISRSAGQLVSASSSMTKQEDGWVVCRVFKKTSSCRASSTAVVGSAGEDVTSTACNRDSTCLFAAADDCGSLQEMFEKLPGLQSPCDDVASSQAAAADAEPVGDWTAFDRLLAWPLEGPSSKPLHRGNDDDGRGDEKFFSYRRGGGGSDLRS